MKKLLAIVDTDEHNFVALFKNKLLDEDITDEFDVHFVLPKLLLSLDRMSEDCAIQLRNAPAPIAAIFVDIVLNESHRTGSNQSGIEIAKHIRSAFPSIPLFSLTGNFESESEIANVSESSTEDVDGIMLKPYLLARNFSASKLRKLLALASAKRQRVGMAGPSVVLQRAVVLPPRGNFRLGDAQVQSDIDAIGEETFWNLLSILLPDVSSGVLRHITQGRSGAAVVKVAALHSPSPNIVGNQKEWLVKIARDKLRISQECENYARLPRMGLHKSSFPHLEKGPEEFGDCSGFVVELQSACVSVGQAIVDTKTDLDVLVASISGTLKALHGKSLPRMAPIWNSSFSLDPRLCAAVRDFLKCNSPVVHSRCGSAAASDVERFIESNGASVAGLLEYAPQTTASLCHNDLNAGNVLVTPAHCAVLIDFASVGEGHAANDYAKLERDLFFRCDGWGTESFHSFQKRARVIEFASGVRGSNLGSEARAFEVAQGVRAAGLASCGAEPGIYWVALLSTCIRALVSPSIPVPRRVAGITYCHEVLKRLAGSIRSSG